MSVISILQELTYFEVEARLNYEENTNAQVLSCSSTCNGLLNLTFLAMVRL